MKIFRSFAVAVLLITSGHHMVAQLGVAPSRSEIDVEITRVKAKLNKTPRSAPLHNQLAALYAALPNLGLAQREIRIAVRLDPTNPIHYVQAASLYERTGDRREIAMLTKASRLDPDSPLIAFKLGRYWERKSELKEARTQLTTAQDLLRKAEDRGIQSAQTKVLLPARIVNDVYYDPNDNAYTVKNLKQKIESSLERISKQSGKS